MHKLLLLFFMLTAALFVVTPTGNAQSPYNLPNNDAGCPANCRQISWLAGSDLWNGGSLPNYTNVTCNGLHNNGVTDDGPLIQACINALSTNQCAFIPAGSNYFINSIVRLKSNTCLRGAKPEGAPPYMPVADAAATTFKLGSGASVTTQNFSFASGDLYPATAFDHFPVNYCTMSGSPHKGDTSFTNNSSDTNCNPHVGDWLEIYGNDDLNLISTTGFNGHCNWCGNATGFYALQQIVQVTNVSGALISISRPWYYTPFTASVTVPGPDGVGTVTEPVGAKFQIITFPTQKAGFENIRFDGSAHDIGSTQILLLQGCLYCWVKNVETYDTGSSSGSAHVELDFSYGDEVRDSAFHDQRSGASGAGYGVYFQFTNTDHKIENNGIWHNRHWTVFQGGGVGIVELYNYADDGYTDDLTFFAQATVSHGAHPMFNLFEGNIASHFAADDFWGSSSHGVVFRNWWRAGEPNTIHTSASGIPSFPPNNGFGGFNLYTGQPYYSFVDNVFGNPGLGSGISGTWSNATLSGYDNAAPPSAPIVYSYGGTASWFSGSNIPSSQTTVIRQGNYDYKTLGVAFNDGGNCGSFCTYTSSLYYTSKPTFLGSCPFPEQGSDLSPIGSILQPAYQRVLGLSGCNVVPIGAPTNMTGTVQVTGNTPIQ